jgi:DSP-PTPase phosphatase fused to NAD+ Kinase
MKRCMTWVLLVVVIGGLLSAVACRSTGTPDAMTAATGHATAAADMDLPPASTTYEVIGVVPGIQKFVVKYDTDFFRGGDIKERVGIEALKARGVRLIVAVTPTDIERALAKEYGIALVELPFTKEAGVPPEMLQKFVALMDGSNAPVYVHCHGGTHRGGTLGVAYRVHVLGWDWDKALVEYGYLGGDLQTDRVMLESVKTLAK